MRAIRGMITSTYIDKSRFICTTVVTPLDAFQDNIAGPLRSEPDDARGVRPFEYLCNSRPPPRPMWVQAIGTTANNMPYIPHKYIATFAQRFVLCIRCNIFITRRRGGEAGWGTPGYAAVQWQLS